MGWLATLHGDLSHLSHEDRAAAEHKVSDALAAVAGELTTDGHVGVAATFHGDTTGDVNLLSPGDTPDSGPPPETEGQPAESAGSESPPSLAVVEGGEGGSEAAPDATGSPSPPSSPSPPLDGPVSAPESAPEGETGQD